MNLINKVTFERKSINLDQLRLLTSVFEHRYDTQGKTSIEVVKINDTLTNLILNYVKESLGSDWLLEEEFDNWLAIDTEDKKYIHRVIVTPNQLVKITEDYADFIAMIKSGVENPWFKLGSLREVYLTKFETGVREVLTDSTIFNTVVITEDKPV